MSEAESQSSAVGESKPELQNTHEHRGLARLIIRWFVRGYYPRIEITGGDLIPQSGPILLCANHANSLLDPVVIGIVCRRPVRFMAKAPLFKHPILGPPMTALGMVPAYRGSDDTKSVRRNLESLDIGAQILIDGHAMGIFPEGKSTDQAHLEMIRSGAARMATQAVEGGAKGVMIVPVGINYQRKERFRSSIWVHVAEPIDVDAAMAAHDFEERKARRALTTELQERLKSVIIHLDEPQWESWLEDLEILVPPREKTPNTPSSILARRKRIAEAINHFLQTDRSRAESVADQIEDYRNSVHASGLQVDSMVLSQRGLMPVLRLLGHLVTLLLLMAPALLGTIYHFIPFFLVRKIAGRMDQPGRKTIATHRVIVGVPLYLLWYIGMTIGLMFCNTLVAWLTLVAAPFSGVIALYYWRLTGQAVRMAWQQLKMALAPGRLNELRGQLQTLRKRLGELSEEYVEVSPPT